MITEADIVDQLTESVTGRVSGIIKESLADIVQTEISKALAKALTEGQFYRMMNKDVIDGIETIYSEISAVKQSLTADSSTDTLTLLGESDSILDSIINVTERATIQILDYLEEMQQEIRELRELADPQGKPSTEDRLGHLDRVILSIMTELSFQDLTAQQIRRVIRSLKNVEEIVFDLYVTSEALKKSKEQAPDQDIQEVRTRVKSLIGEAKDKRTIVDQGGVDALLEQLGL
jgi:chemotaxis protein CheZ